MRIVLLTSTNIGGARRPEPPSVVGEYASQLTMALEASGIEILVVGREQAGEGHERFAAGSQAPVGPVDCVVGFDRVPEPWRWPCPRILFMSGSSLLSVSDMQGCVNLDAVVVSSEHGARQARAILHDPGRIVVIPPTVDAVDVEIARDRLLFLGPPWHGLRRLLRMWPEIHDQLGIPLSVAGDLRAAIRASRVGGGPAAEHYRDVEGLLDQPGVVVHGSLDREGLARLLSRSEACVYPADTSIEDTDWSGLSVLRACAGGCLPVVASTGCYAEVVGEVAQLVPDDEDEPDRAARRWYEAIAQALRTGPERRHACREVAARCHSSAFRDRWLTLIEDLVRNGVEEPSCVSMNTGSVADGDRWLFACAGSALGETAAAIPVIEAARRRGHVVVAMADRARNCDLLVTAADEVHLLNEVKAWTAIDIAGFQAVVVSGSLTCGTWLPRLADGRDPRTPIASIECAWFPWVTGDPSHFRSIDLFLPCLPPGVFRAGLRDAGGPFSFPAEIAKRIQPTGFLFPHATVDPGQREDIRRSHGISPELRVILVMQGTDAGQGCLQQEDLVGGTDLLREEISDLRVMVTAGPEVDLPDHIVQLPWLQPERFHSLVGAVDLLLSTSLGTTVQRAVRSNVPTVVWPRAAPPGLPPLGAWEAEALERAGLVGRIPEHPSPLTVYSALKSALTDHILHREWARVSDDPAEGAEYAVRLIEEASRQRHMASTPADLSGLRGVVERR